MASMYDSITIARSAILAHQERMSVTSNNIANINTPGYHRQRAVLSANPPINPTMAETRHYPIGTGVRVADVVRTYDQFKESLLQEQVADASYHQTMASGLSDLQAMLNGVDSAGLATSLQKFWNAWQDVSTNPDSIAQRNVLIETSVQLTNAISGMADTLDSFRADICNGTAPNITGYIPSEIAQANTMISEIQTLNKQIARTINGYTPHDLMDRRDQLIKDLSEKINITVGSDFEITLDGQQLVSSDGLTAQSLMVSDATTPIQLSVIDAASTVTNINVTGGSIGAWVSIATSIDDPASSLKTRLDTLVDQLVTDVNTLHNSGYDLEGVQGGDFFTAADVNGDGLLDASSIAVDGAIHDVANPMNDNPRLIAAAATRYSAGPPEIPNTEDGRIALQIADLAASAPAALGAMRYEQYFAAGMVTLGTQISSEIEMADNGESVITMLTNSIQAESGVSLDEEMINMMEAQRAYQAASRLFNTLDGMLDLLINRLGV